MDLFGTKRIAALRRRVEGLEQAIAALRTEAAERAGDRERARAEIDRDVAAVRADVDHDVAAVRGDVVDGAGALRRRIDELAGRLDRVDEAGTRDNERHETLRLAVVRLDRQQQADRERVATTIAAMVERTAAQR